MDQSATWHNIIYILWMHTYVIDLVYLIIQSYVSNSGKIIAIYRGIAFDQLMSRLVFGKKGNDNHMKNNH